MDKRTRLPLTFLRSQEGFSAGEAVMLCCTLGAICVLVGLQISKGGDSLASRADRELASGSPTGGAPARRNLQWDRPVGEFETAGSLQQPGRLASNTRGIQGPGSVAPTQGTWRDAIGEFSGGRKGLQGPGALGTGGAIQGSGGIGSGGGVQGVADPGQGPGTIQSPGRGRGGPGGIQQPGGPGPPGQQSSGLYSALSTGAHALLGAAGFIPGIGTITNIADATLYAAEGNKVDAAISLAAAVPIAGTGVKVVNAGVKGTRALRGAGKVAQATRAVEAGKDAGAASRLSAAARRDAARKRQERMLRRGTGYNVSPKSWDKYPTIGRNGSFLTDRKALDSVLRGVKPGTTSMTISKRKAANLEKNLGLEPGSLSGGFKIRRVENIAERSPRSPLEGNRFFKGPGEHLPGGGPELVVDSIPTTDGKGVTTIVEVIVR